MIRQQLVEIWRKIVDDPGLPFNCTILVDADIGPGHAYVEVSGARIDVGKQARIALVRAALGLDRDDKEQDLENQNQGHPDNPDLSNQYVQDDSQNPPLLDNGVKSE